MTEAGIPPRRVAEALQFLFEVYDATPLPLTLQEWIEVLEKGGSEGAFRGAPGEREPALAVSHPAPGLHIFVGTPPRAEGTPSRHALRLGQ